MKRLYVLGIIVLAGVLAAAKAELGAQAPAGQAPGAPGAPGQGRGGGGRGGGGGGVGMIQKINDTLYWIPGAGGNTAVFITAKGVVLVDTKNPNNGEGILAQVKSVTDKPVTHIINTHTHGDHNGSNVYFPATVEIVTHEATAANMMKMKNFAEDSTKHGLPDRTYKDRMELLSGNDAIDLYYFGPAHTNGDTLVVFRNARVMHAGDMFANQAQPLIDRNNGGSGIEYGETIGKAAKGIKNVQTVITGHNTMTTLTWQDFVDYGEFNRLYLQHARESLKAGKTAEQAAMDLKLPEKFKNYQLAGGRGGPGGNFNIIFEELKASGK
jgi:glyoxylase-like metal-dependent hydrolase (beta-lactamase superfamily II)